MTTIAKTRFEALKDRFGKTDRMPVMFLGHGNPLNAITRNPWAAGWEAVGQALPRPRAVLWAQSSVDVIPVCSAAMLT